MLIARGDEGVVLGGQILWIYCGLGAPHRGIGPRGPRDDATSSFHVSSASTLILGLCR